MKLHLSIGQQELSGYTNIDLAKYSIDLVSFDGICGQAECTHFIANEILTLLHITNMPKVFEYWVSRLRHKAKITFIFRDFSEIKRRYDNKEINLVDFNTLVFGTPPVLHKSCLTTDIVVTLAQQCDLNISSIEFENLNAIVTLQRK